MRSADWKQFQNDPELCLRQIDYPYHTLIENIIVGVFNNIS